MVEEKAEVQRQYALIEDAKKAQEQFVRDMNSLTKSGSYDHLVDLCYRHMQAGPLRDDTLMMIKGFYRVDLEEETAGAILDLILEWIQRGHYSKFAGQDGVSFGLSSLPNSMSIVWSDVRSALMKARHDGQGR